MPPDAAPTTLHTARNTVPAAELFELLTVTDVAALLKVSKSWVYEHTRAWKASFGSSASHQAWEVRAI
jgi:hypothetical protein